MNALKEKYGPRGFEVIGFPCNQFGKQENTKNEEILQTLKHVRPGGGYEPKFLLSEKIEVNGKGQAELFTWLKESLPMPFDETELSGAREGSTSNGFLMGDGLSIIWSPVRRYDIAWNFEKFLIDGDGNAIRRYSRFYDTNAIASDIEELLK